MTFSDDLARITVKIDHVSKEVFARVVDKAHESIVNGSATTGAPGQPVDTGALRASWQKTYEDASHATIATNLVYAPAIEEGEGPHGELTLRSPVGGFHSVKLTQASMQQLVDEAVREVNS
jgi:hypothetical protein